jgi:hypothetical protein
MASMTKPMLTRCYAPMHVKRSAPSGSWVQVQALDIALGRESVAQPQSVQSVGRS